MGKDILKRKVPTKRRLDTHDASIKVTMLYGNMVSIKCLFSLNYKRIAAKTKQRCSMSQHASS